MAQRVVDQLEIIEINEDRENFVGRFSSHTVGLANIFSAFLCKASLRNITMPPNDSMISSALVTPAVT